MGNCPPSDQSDLDRLVGTWKIVSIVFDLVGLSGRTSSYPATWYGYIILTAEHRAIVIQTVKDRPVPETDDEYIYALCSMIAYSGKYRIIANKIVINVDIAWNEHWNGTDQIWFYRFEKDQLIIEDPLNSYPEIPNTMFRVTWTCERDS